MDVMFYHFDNYSLADHVSQSVVFFVDGEYGSISDFRVQFLNNSGWWWTKKSIEFNF